MVGNLCVFLLAYLGCTREASSAHLIKGLYAREIPLKSQMYLFGPDTLSFVRKLGDVCRGVFAPSLWHPASEIDDDHFFGRPQDFMDRLGFEPTSSMAYTAAALFVMMESFKATFKPCDISMSGGDVDKILFDPSAIS